MLTRKVLTKWVPVSSTRNVKKWREYMRAVDAIQVGLRKAAGYHVSPWLNCPPRGNHVS